MKLSKTHLVYRAVWVGRQYEQIQAYSAHSRITIALTSSASFTFKERMDLEELKKHTQLNQFQTGLEEAKRLSFTHNNH